MEMSTPAHASIHSSSIHSGAGGAPAPAPNNIPSSPSDISLAATKLQNIKFINATSYMLTALMVCGMVLFGVREEGIYGDDFLWMKYQTLVTPPKWTNYIWLLIFLLQGLFIYASTLHPTLQNSPLVGYSFAISSPKQSVAVHYPAICASTLMMVYAFDYGHELMACLSSVLCLVVLGSVLKIQGEVLNEMEAEANNNNTMMDENVANGYVKETDNDDNDMVAVHQVMGSMKSRAVQYFSFRLPFELYGGYVLSRVALYLNTFLHSFENLPTIVYLVVANVSLVGLLAVGFMILWKIPGRKFYGAGASLVWYLLGVSIELHTPTQPIYNEFSDNAILTTQIVATVSTTILMILLGVRINKTMIKYNFFNCVGTLGGGDNESVFSDDPRDMSGISTDYVAA